MGILYGEEKKISQESDLLDQKSILIAASVDLEVEWIAVPSTEEKTSDRVNEWGIGIFRFRFRPEKFRLGRDLAQRRFNIAEAAVLLMLAYIASRGLGVIRQIIFNALFGTGPQASAYYAAFRLPDNLFNLIAGGTLVYALIPIFVSYEKDSEQQELWRLASLIFNLLLVILTALVLVGEFVAPTFVSHWLVPGYSTSEQALTTSLTRIMLLQPLILGLSTIATGILSSKRQFFLPALSIAVYNVGLIGGLLFTLAFPRIGIYGPTFGVLAAAVCMMLVQLQGLFKQGLRYAFIWDLKHPGLRGVMRLLGPNILAVGIASIALTLDTALASYIPDKGSLAALHNALLLFDFPLALLGQAVAQAALPQMSMLAVAGHFEHLRRLTLKVVGGSVLLSMLAALVLWLLGKPIIQILFQHGAFTRHSTALTVLALIGYIVGLPGHTANELLGRSFYASKDAVTPLIISIIGIGARIGLVLFLFKLLPGHLLILTIPLAGAGAVTMQAGALCMLFLRRLRRKVEEARGVSKIPASV